MNIATKMRRFHFALIYASKTGTHPDHRLWRAESTQTQSHHHLQAGDRWSMTNTSSKFWTKPQLYITLGEWYNPRRMTLQGATSILVCTVCTKATQRSKGKTGKEKTLTSSPVGTRDSNLPLLSLSLPSVLTIKPALSLRHHDCTFIHGHAPRISTVWAAVSGCHLHFSKLLWHPEMSEMSIHCTLLCSTCIWKMCDFRN